MLDVRNLSFAYRGDIVLEDIGFFRSKRGNPCDSETCQVHCKKS